LSDVSFSSKPLTRPQQRVFDALSTEFERPIRIAERAGIRTQSTTEAVSKYLNQLTKMGLAEKGGRRDIPTWRRAKPDVAGH
jgi:hypothetical protein